MYVCMYVCMYVYIQNVFTYTCWNQLYNSCNMISANFRLCCKMDQTSRLPNTDSWGSWYRQWICGSVGTQFLSDEHLWTGHSCEALTILGMVYWVSRPITCFEYLPAWCCWCSSSIEAKFVVTATWRCQTSLLDAQNRPGRWVRGRLEGETAISIEGCVTQVEKCCMATGLMGFRWRPLGLKPQTHSLCATSHVKGNFWQLQLLLRGTGRGPRKG